ncbi:MAG: sulfatase-like hydrolase/transferase [Endomicrobium sp.]|jgi:phosphoglycerol transferase MdoB-like AlkP superfamily enzyme|nr:sulfatase-like hydrolase/transferase [Endomicrobium sp.]
MKDLKNIVLKLASVNLLFLFFMSAYRVIFFIHFGKGIDLRGFGLDILKAFFMGARLDLSVIGIINSPAALAFVVILIFGKSLLFRYFFSFLKYYYCIFIGLILTILCIDFNFYSYFQEHLNVLIFGFVEDDTKALIQTFYKNYNLLLIGTLVIFFFIPPFFVSKFILKFKEYNFKFQRIFLRFVFSLLILVFIFIAMRGTVVLHPIGVYTDVSSNMFVNKIAINCFYTLQRAFEHRARERKSFDYIEKSGYKNNIRQAFADFLGKDIEDIAQNNPETVLVSKTPYNAQAKKLKPNIILILMESLGRDIIKYNSPEFNILGGLKKHFDEDIVFYNFCSEGRITIEALEALFLNIVLKPRTSICFSQSKLVYNKYPFASILPYKRNDYNTIFMYGDNTSWKNVGVFAARLGFDEILNEAGALIPDSSRGTWGVYDEYLFDAIFDSLSKGNKSKFIFSLTTTNHTPYSLPKGYKKLLLEIPTSLRDKIFDIDDAYKRFTTYQYANEMLARLIDKIKKSKYADNTIIAVTGDHNFNAYQIDSLLRKVGVPFYLYIPKSLKPENVDTSVFGSHLDIMPTLYNLSLSNESYMSQGIDLFSSKAKDNAIVNQDFIMNKFGAVEWDIVNDKLLYFMWDEKYILKSSTKTYKLERLQKHFLSMVAISDYLIKNTGQ